MQPSSSMGSATSLHSANKDQESTFSCLMPVLVELKCCSVQRTCVRCEFGLAGVGAGQILGRAGVDARMIGAGVEDDQ